VALTELVTFMAAIRNSESGSFDGNYGLQNRDGLGAYGISRGNWSKWTTEAGLPGADWHSRSAQDAVARFKMTQMYNRYGDWRLVQLAWLYGSEAADLAKTNGLPELFGALGVQFDTAPLVADMNEAFRQGYATASVPPALVSRLDDQAAEAVTVGALSVNREYSPTPEVTAPSGPADLPRVGQGATPATPADPGVPGEPATPAEPADPWQSETQRQLHANVSALLQGLSNSIRAGASQAGLPSAITPEERAMLDIDGGGGL
jgi:hypothetical protein